MEDKIFLVVSDSSNKHLVIKSHDRFKSLILDYQQRKRIKDPAPMKFDDDPAPLLSEDDESNNGWDGFQDYKTFQFHVKDLLREIAKKMYDFAEFVHTKDGQNGEAEGSCDMSMKRKRILLLIVLARESGWNL